jgi:glutamate dehydrogenase
VLAGLANVTNVAEDKVLRQFTDTIMATLRTNFYQLDEEKQIKNYISFKFDSGKVPNLPRPRPHAEIFVYGCDVEGVHLRGGKVARGGLRWSDRHEDFRTEVLGLVKAQQVKNSVIVPVGSKGGFVVKNPIIGSRDEVVAQGQECYKRYLSGLLDITDNIVDGKVVPPARVVRHDDDDPYLVVAADKGTATFSDIANSVSEKYGFWLGDAFASGGSVGYDHKKMGITARGAWVSVQRHFMEMGIDCQNEDFTCIGIGDMAGDVFGNGMLLSKHNRLVGAFNHMHIFLDPEPQDVLKSWNERERLFELPRSSWLDYDSKLISKGGGVFERSAKEIKLTKEIKALLDIEEDKISPDALIRAMIKARVDLLWNGGIGTYVKAEVESIESVGDKANDNLRVNGKELRCKIIGEGGNLGFTQLARIEYDQNGGRVNTDAIDNSAGVDCSDHEVNIKIALNQAVENGKMTVPRRNSLLARMTDDVGHMVLRDNALQTQAITIAQMQGHMILEQKARMMEAFEERGFLDRKIEFLPDADTLVTRQSAKLGFARPEISVILAYAKMDIYEDLLSSNLPDDVYLEDTVVAYFPKEMRKSFVDELKSHQLRREIITTVVANDIVNRMGSTFYHRMKENTGLKGCDVARSYIVTRDAYRLTEIWDEIEALGATVDVAIQTQMFLETRKLVERASSWFLRNSSHPLQACSLVADFADGIQEISVNFDEIVSTTLKDASDVRKADYLAHNVPEKLASKVANLGGLASASDIVQVSRHNKTSSLVEIGKVYYSVGSRLGLTWLRSTSNKLLSHSHWENLAVQTFTETFFDQQMRVTHAVVDAGKSETDAKAAVENWCEANSKNLSRYDMFISDLRRQEVIDQSMLTVAIQRGEGLFSN